MRTDLPMPTVRPRTVLPLPGPGCDCRQCAFWMGPDGKGGPATVEPLCSGTNSSCSYCGCARAEVGSPQGACASSPIRCGSRTDIAAWMADVGGTLAFDDLAPTGVLPNRLPSFVPQVDGSAVTELDAGLDWAAYAVSLRRVFSPRSSSIYPRFKDADAHTVLGLRPGQLAVLCGHGEDPLVESRTTRGRPGRCRAVPRRSDPYRAGDLRTPTRRGVAESAPVRPARRGDDRERPAGSAGPSPC